MAGSAAMQSVLGASSFACAANYRINKANTYFLRPLNLPRLRIINNAPLRVRCMTEDADQKELPTPVTNSPPQLTPAPSPPPTPKVSTKFSDVSAFSAPAPERINRRVATAGFVATMAVELFKGQDVFAQTSNGGISWFVGTCIMLSRASLAPLLTGVSAESKSSTVMTSDAELWSGRFANDYSIALAFTEYVRGGTLV